MKIYRSLLIKFGMILGALFLALSLGGCATKPRPPFEIKSPEMGMIYGNIHIPGHEVTEIELRKYGKLYIPPFITPPRVMIFRNGNFVAENLKPGSYYISRLLSHKTAYAIVKDERSAYQYIINVEPGSIEYIGSFELVTTKLRLLNSDFKIKVKRHPSERAILKHMYEVTRGTGWQSRVDRRIKYLR